MPKVQVGDISMSLTGFERQCDAVQAHDALERVAAIRCPTLISAADQDILVPPRFARALAERVPGAVFRLIEGAGHGYFWERPDAFNAACLDFLSTVPGRDQSKTLQGCPPVSPLRGRHGVSGGIP
jgi:pimeloyl-ACP methyl ester carboxylesterase